MTSPWSAFLLEQGARLDPAATNPVSFRSPREEVELAARTTVLVPLHHLGLIHADGDEARDFLHNISSNDVKQLGPGRAQHNSLNGPKGRMLANFVMWQAAGGYDLMLAAELHAATLKKLAMYVLRAKVRLSDAGSERVLLGLAGPQAASVIAAAGLDVPADVLTVSGEDSRVIHLDTHRFVIDCPASTAISLWQALRTAGANAAGSPAWRWLDIQTGLPVLTAATQDEFVAQMLNFELLGGVSFKKGCFPGQEIIARTQNLGKLKKRMFRAHVAETAAAQPGADLYAPEFGTQSCGKIVSVTEAPTAGMDLLAVMQIAAFEAGEVHLGEPEGPRLSLSSLPYAVD